jgi:hypothetical protein
LEYRLVEAMDRILKREPATPDVISYALSKVAWHYQHEREVSDG